MKPAGVVRKVDQLGRIVLPKSLRKRYQMNEGDPVEILVQGDHIILEDIVQNVFSADPLRKSMSLKSVTYAHNV